MVEVRAVPRCAERFDRAAFIAPCEHGPSGCVHAMERTVPRSGSPCRRYQWRELCWCVSHHTFSPHGLIKVLFRFVGFYYVCVEFEPQPGSPSPASSQPLPEAMPGCIESGFVPYQADPSPFSHLQRHRGSRRKPPATPAAAWEDAELAPGEVPRARMLGYYYHKNSEPYVNRINCPLHPN